MAGVALPMALSVLGTSLGGPAGTALGIGSTVGGAVGGGLGSAAGAGLTGKNPLRAGLMGAAGGAAMPLLKKGLGALNLSDVLGKNGSAPPDFDQDSTDLIPVTPAATKTSAGASLSALPQPNASPSSSRLAMLEELRRRFAA